MLEGMRRVLVLAATPPLAAAGAVAAQSRLQSSPAQLALPPPPRPAWVVPNPATLAPIRGVSWWAPVRRAVVVRARPSATATPVGRVSTRTPEGTQNILELLGRALPGRSGLWQRVRLAVLPNGTTGWVPRWALAEPVILDTHLVIDRARFRATLFRDGVSVFSAPVGVGRARSPTPVGNFYVRDVLTRYRRRSYGPIAFGTSARSATLTDWPAGGYIGIHGTDRPQLIPGSISHGCIRLRNADILKLAALMPVGTPVTVK